MVFQGLKEERGFVDLHCHLMARKSLKLSPGPETGYNSKVTGGDGPYGWLSFGLKANPSL